MLIDAHDEFEQDVQKAVSNGIGQLGERLNAIRSEPGARTMSGIVKELHSRVGAIRESQAKKAQSDSLWGLYADFPLVTSRVQEAAPRYFDHEISTLAKRLANDLRAGNKRLPAGDRKMIERQIRSDLPAHHEAVSSRELLKSKINEIVAADRQWISASFKTSLEEAQSPFDAAFSAQDSKDIDRAMASPGSEAMESWNALKNFLTEQYGKLVEGVRDQIAAEQGQQYAPRLAKKTWRPSEKEIGDFARKLEPRQLRSLDVWTDSPPGDRDVLEETWNNWVDGAREGIKVGQQAMLEQENVVSRLKNQMAVRMRGSHGEGMAEWIAEYSRLAQEEWQQSGGQAATDYPALFLATRQKIRAVVIELLGIVAREQEDEAKRLAAEAQSGRNADLRADRLAEEAKKRVVSPTEVASPDTNKPIGIHERKPMVLPQVDANADTETGSPHGTRPGKIGSGAGGTEGDGRPGHVEVYGDRSGSGAGGHGSGKGYGNGYGYGDHGYPYGSGSGSGGSGNGHGSGSGSGIGTGYGDGDSPYAFYFKVYQIGFWGLFFLLIVMAGCWYWNIKFLHQYYIARTTTDRKLGTDFRSR
ncbi:MAG: hypothetical protein ABSG53_10760 [Thermoguttaceae bacterium]